MEMETYSKEDEQVGEAGPSTKESKEKEEDEEGSVYSKLKTQSEDIYSRPSLDNPQKDKQEVNSVTRRYRNLSAILFIVSLLFLVLIIILCLKLQVQTAQPCEVCSFQMCKNVHPGLCSPCQPGWLYFQNYCYLFSTETQTWDESKAKCSKEGGNLVIITNEEVQKFLSEKGNLIYWIGLRRTAGQNWRWVNNTALEERQSYWTQIKTEGNCGTLMAKGKYPIKENWKKAECSHSTYYICQINV